MDHSWAEAMPKQHAQVEEKSWRSLFSYSSLGQWESKKGIVLWTMDILSFCYYNLRTHRCLLSRSCDVTRHITWYVTWPGHSHGTVTHHKTSHMTGETDCSYIYFSLGPYWICLDHHEFPSARVPFLFMLSIYYCAVVGSVLHSVVVTS